MNQSGVLTTKEERDVFIGKDYKTPNGACEVIARLDYRNWYNRKSVYALVCNFTTESGEKLALFAFRRRLPNPEIYAPQKGDIDFAHDVKEGTWWRCVIKATKSGRYKWYSAEPIEHN
jgi:hypothetical protein